MAKIPAGCLVGSRFLEGKIPDPLKHGARAVRFIENIKHTEGSSAGQPFKLHPWQKKIVVKTFGDTDRDGRRKIRTVFLLLPRGNGKTTLVSAIGLLTTLGPERDPAGQVICAAADREQATIAYNAACRMIRADPELTRITRIVDSRRSIFHPKSESVYRAISHEAYSKHGLSISTLLADEIHAWPTRDLWEVLTGSMGKRDAPLTFITTTAGIGRGGIAWELYKYALAVEQGSIKDPSFLPVLYAAPADCDWRDEAIWRAVNPAIGGGFRSLEEMRITARRAAESPIARESFRRLYLNNWLEASMATWIEMAIYDENPSTPVSLADFEGRENFMGIDMASVGDLAALLLATREGDGWKVWCRQYCPEQQIRKRAAAGLAYPEWVDRGELIATPGDAIDQGRIESDIASIVSEIGGVKKIAVDRWGAIPFMNRLAERGLPVVQFGQGYQSMTGPCKEIERAILGRQFHHGGNALLRWNLSNVRPEIDAAGNIKFSKDKAVEKIDGAVAAAMAIGAALTDGADQDNQPSIYESHGLRIL
jgi:phage terminase large subunit-like protein